MAVLLILSGKHQGKRLAFPSGEVIVGRDASCQVRLATEEVSRKHCRLRCEQDEVFVSDLGSRNGTLINDHLITAETPLLPGDVLRIGPIALQLLGKRPIESGTGRQPSDDSIMDWLADEGASSTSDSTIIPRDPAPALKAKPIVETPPPPTLTPFPPTKKFKTVGEEGEEIIQQHFALIQSGQRPKRIAALTTETTGTPDLAPL